jgi:hypothetical protein
MKRLPFNACDYRCERCHVTSECAVYRKLQQRSLLHGMNGVDENDPAVILEDIRESFRETEEMIKQKAREFGIDIDEIAGRTTAAEIEEQEATTRKDPLFKQAEEFMRETNGFLKAADTVIAGEDREYFNDLAWHHTVIAAKIFRALGWRTDPDDSISFDGKNSAAVAAKSLAICVLAFDQLAARYPALAEQCNRLAARGGDIRDEIRKRFKLAGNS